MIMMLCAVVLVGGFGVNAAYALTGDLEDFSDVNIPKTVAKGDAFTGAFTSPSFASLSLNVCGLTKLDTLIDDIVQRPSPNSGAYPETNLDRLLYEGTLTRGEGFKYTASIDTATVPAGEYRFWVIFVRPNYSYTPVWSVRSYSRFYFSEDIKITAKDDPAKDDPAKDDPAKDDPAKDKPSIDVANVGAISAKAYTGKQIKPAVTVKMDGALLKKGVDYTVKYGANKNIGKGAITITGKGKYAGDKKLTFKIIPKKNSLSGITVAKKQMKVTWKKVSAVQKITKYELRYRVKGTAKWKSKSYKASASSATIKSLTKGKAYEVQARCYKKVAGKK
jgi:hypothetical protein